MGTTSNYGLYVTDDAQEKVKELLEKMSNTTDSNMVKIDTALREKADHSDQFFGVLLASAWEGDDAPYTQEISIEGLSATQNGGIAVSQDATFEQRQAAREAVLNLAGQSDGKLIVVADGTLPETDIPFVITLLK